MPLRESRLEELKRVCAKFRIELIELLHDIQTGHPGGSLSLTEILAILYFDKMRLDPANPDWEGRDRLILSKGHGAPMLYLALAHRGFFPVEEIKTLRQLNSRLQGHPCRHKLPGVELSTGPLGLGLSAGLGMALALRRSGNDESKVYVILGDGECQEGAIWEAALSANKFKANNLIAILDNNGVQLDGTNDEIMPMGDIGQKFAAFGWKAIYCDGHDLSALSDAIDEAKANAAGPTMIVAKTIKGKGVSFMEGKNTWHGSPISDENYKDAMSELCSARKFSKDKLERLIRRLRAAPSPRGRLGGERRTVLRAFPLGKVAIRFAKLIELTDEASLLDNIHSAIGRRHTVGADSRRSSAEQLSARKEATT